MNSTNLLTRRWFLQQCGVRFQILVMVILLASSTAHVAAPLEPTTELRQPERNEWIVGTWRSDRLDYGDFGEWKGTKQIELMAQSARQIDLILISANGEHSRAGDSRPSILDEKRSCLFFGPIGSGLRFHYHRRSEDVLILDLNAAGARIHAEFRRVGPARGIQHDQ